MLFTGSRAWADADCVHADLAHEVALAQPGRIYVLHGDCPTGLDAIVAGWLRENADGDRIVGFPLAAPWQLEGKKAGPMRNRGLVSVLGELRRLGAVTRCLGYPLGVGRGTRNCMGAAAGFSHEILDRSAGGFR